MKKTKEFSYSPGMLAKKIGTSRTTLLRHLKETELIDQCYRTATGYLRIPYNVAVSLASPEALAVQKTREVLLTRAKKSRRPDLEGWRKKKVGDQVSKSTVSSPADTFQPNYTQIGTILRGAGVTIYDVLKYIENTMEVAHEQQQDNSAQRNNENQAGEPEATSS